VRRIGGSQRQITALRSEASAIAKQIQGMYAFLIKPKTGSDADGNWSRAFTMARDGQRRKWGHDFYSTRPLPPNRIAYIGVPEVGPAVSLTYDQLYPTRGPLNRYQT